MDLNESQCIIAKMGRCPIIFVWAWVSELSIEHCWQFRSSPRCVTIPYNDHPVSWQSDRLSNGYNWTKWLFHNYITYIIAVCKRYCLKLRELWMWRNHLAKDIEHFIRISTTTYIYCTQVKISIERHTSRCCNLRVSFKLAYCTCRHNKLCGRKDNMWRLKGSNLCRI